MGLRQVLGLSLGLLPGIAAAQSAPSGPHPRIWLDGGTVAAMRARRADATSGTARAFAACADARTNPADHAMGGTFSFAWGFVAASCGLAFQVGGDAADAATGLVYLNALLDDYQAVGDAMGGDDVVRHDTGYSIRTYAPYAALAYDWLHDAPGMTEGLRAHARARFKAWTDWYTTSGYLTDIAGANYQAGYTFAATMVAIAEGGEAGADGDALWRTTVDTIFHATLARGFGTAAADPANDLAPGGVLVGGDWTEGWQYGPLSVLEYALSSRALEEQGVALPAFDSWASTLVLRSLYATNPRGDGHWVGGDFDSDQHWQEISPRTLLASLLGPSSPEAQAWARAELQRVGTHDEGLFEALADGRPSAATPFPSTSPTTYYAPGSHTLYVRDRWAADAAWAVFHAGPRMVPDHEHPDTGNWALSRGADDLVVDPSPYGSRSTLTGNAPAVDSALLNADYTPSQTPWNAFTVMAWRRVTDTGIVAARADYHDAFRFRDRDTDVPVALRDWVFLPHGGGDATVVLVDRIQTGDAARGAHLRVRTPAALTLNGPVATGTLGASRVVLRVVQASGGQPTVRHVTTPDCDSAPHFGSCDSARFPVDELAQDLAGPSASSLVLVDATGAAAPMPDATLRTGAGFRAAAFTRAGKSFLVVTSDAPNAAPGATLTYTAPAARTVHIVVDAPVGAEGRSDVNTTLVGTDCQVVVTPHAGASGGFDGRPLLIELSSACAAGEVGSMATDIDAGVGGVDASVREGGTGGGGDAAAAGDGAAGDGGTSPPPRGCGCRTQGSERATGLAGLAGVAALALLARGRRRAGQGRRA